ncbi:MAG TPA: cytochrome c peroxidase [Burkholderiales bacterium]|nr:cytochrome c peroxidase [Burkholderiales bacterium]
MTTTRVGVWLAGACAFAAIFACVVSAQDSEQDLLERARQMFKPLPPDASTSERPVTAERVALGKALFFETRASVDGAVSCAKCHQPTLYGTDALATSIGNHDKVLPRNAPTVFNAALQFAQHYGGNRRDVEEQAVKALVSPLSYGNPDYAAAEAKLRAIPGYRPLFEKAFPGEAEPVNAENWGKAIGAYERVLLTPAPFDRYLTGDTRALSVQAKRGLDKFMSFGCSGCHNGVTVGGQMYQKFGLVQDYWTATGSEKIDKGRFNDTKDEADTYIFKVQQLRNVARTPPYFHDGSVADVRDAVRIMAKVQLGRDVSPDDIADIVAFLESLTGEVPPQFASVPNLPSAPYRN